MMCLEGLVFSTTLDGAASRQPRGQRIRANWTNNYSNGTSVSGAANVSPCFQGADSSVEGISCQGTDDCKWVWLCCF